MSRTHLVTLLIAAASGAVAGVLVNAAVSDRTEAGGGTSSTVAALDEGRVARLEAENVALQRAIAELRDGQALLASRGDRSSVPAELAAPAARPAEADDVPAAAPEPAAEALTVDAALARLCDPDAPHSERAAMWEAVAKAGLLDAVVDGMKQRVDREPNNPDLRVELGNAYLQEVFAASEMSKGKWAMRADAAFDAALELDPQHWEARFTKAVSLSNWPAFLGKQSAAIKEFETLIEQQNAVPKQDHHWQTYLYLGNMYQASGSTTKALEAWEKGALLFPENPALQQQIANSKKP